MMVWPRTQTHRRKRRNSHRIDHLHAVEALESRQLLAASTPVISEFMAINDSGSIDNFNERSDWIEIQNPTSSAVNLLGYHLTDDEAVADKWTFPAVSINAGGYLVVRASNRNIAVAGQPLHTNFKLDGDGEYLALTAPDNTVLSTFGNELTPFYPPQRADVAYGVAQGGVSMTLVAAGAGVRTFIPSAASGLPLNWTARTGFDDISWTPGSTGIGYEKQTGYENLIGADVSGMYGVTSS